MQSSHSFVLLFIYLFRPRCIFHNVMMINASGPGIILTVTWDAESHSAFATAITSSHDHQVGLTASPGLWPRTESWSAWLEAVIWAGSGHTWHCDHNHWWHHMTGTGHLERRPDDGPGSYWSHRLTLQLSTGDWACAVDAAHHSPGPGLPGAGARALTWDFLIFTSPQTELCPAGAASTG